ncbi:MAG TPA: sodium:alanine symporter family protein [Clostridiaceae bacterium]|jgi:AGCS family alanine or glycine:cation symporter|nr:sodium:alanine symporter family protein [Clostridiaceae bacterium]HBF77148.1 sodium:alanine symporter family protein [Clostridiaceae bacterium]HBG38123.1 sodium:alanine symporter family protein [Clostridiaceae bacterium]HBN28291.1 sodium:alanine symporter family protein [Clostridiaceae bacterium]HBX48170.1 sodium:alanine symporter family protein [Clostridiaceae bacterium]
MEELLTSIADAIWGPWMLIALLGTGLYLSIGTKFVQLTKFKSIMKDTLGALFKKTKRKGNGEGTITPFQALATALAATIGVGNIVGVATALQMGGPGAVFWMLLSAFVGECTKYSEITLSIKYRKKDEEGNFIGGPHLYMEKGLNAKWLAVIFSICISFFCFGDTMVQSNSIVEAIQGDFPGANAAIIGIVIVVLAGIVLVGGLKSIAKISEKIVPFMSLLYFICGMIVLFLNINKLPMVIGLIFKGAFTKTAAVGGLAGYTVKEAIKAGVSRGVYSNEAGQGTAPIAHATAITDHPCRQAMWGVTEVFLDTFVVCNITALSILLTETPLNDGTSPALLAAKAFGSIAPFFKYFVTFSLILFAYTTILGMCYYGESCCTYLGGVKLGKIYRYIYIPINFVGAVGGLKTIWSALDIVMGIGVIPNIIALVLLSPQVFKLNKDFFNRYLPSLKKSSVKSEI